MISSFAISVVFFVLAKTGHGAAVRADGPLSRSAFTTVCWLIAAFVSAADRAGRRSIAFYKKVHPAGPGLGARFARGRRQPRPRPRSHGDHMGMATLGWISGCADDLVVALRDRQLPLRPHGSRADPHRGLRRQRRDAALRDQTLVGSAGAGTLSVTWWSSRRRRAFPPGVLASRSRGRRSAQSPASRG